MNLPPSDFADAFRALVVPKLRSMIESRGFFVAIGLDRFSEAHNEIMAEASRLGASYLPHEHLNSLIDWTQTALLNATIAAEARVHGD